jgi:hypothetical protein
MAKWWREIERYWSKPRTLAKYDQTLVDGSQIPSDPVSEVAPDGAAQGDTYPYFWFHYLFSYLLKHDTEFSATWALCTKRSAAPPVSL